MNHKIKEFIRSELSGWTAPEVSWLLFCCAAVTACSWSTDTLIGILSAVTGILNVILNGKGKVSSYLFGLINIVLYTYISYSARFYGMAMLYALYFFPMNIYGFFSWSRHIDSETCEVEKRRISARWRWISALTVIAAAGIYGYGLQRLGGSLPYIDALITSLSIVAMAATVKRCYEQWVMWIIADVITAVMWAIDCSRGSSSIATLMMWIIFVINGVIMYVRWRREVQRRSEAAESRPENCGGQYRGCSEDC